MIKGKLKLTITVISLILITCLSAGCFNMSAGSMLNYRLRHIGDNDALIRESEEKTFATINKAVEEKDSDAIYELFSKTAKDSGVTKESIDELIEILHGNQGEWEDSSTHTSEKNDYGVKSVVYGKNYSIMINSEPYVLNIKECVRDDKNENNIGLMRVTLYFRVYNLGLPRERIGAYGAFFLTKEEVESFKDELLKQRKEKHAREKAEMGLE